MTTDLVLRPSCSGCGSTSDLYGSNCKHKTLCVSCGKSMAEKKAKCSDCGATLTRLIREYSVLANAVDDKDYFIGRFSTGVPKFLEKKKKKKKNCENKWSLYKKKSKDGLQGRQDSFQDKLLKNKPWVLEDETGQSQYQGQPEEQSAAYYILMREGKEISAIPAGSWFNFNKVAQYKQFTLEEAEEKMNSRKKAQHGYERWMMKAATNGAVAFSEVEKFGGKDSKNTTGDDDEGNFSDKGDEDEEEEGARKNRHRVKKRGGDDEGASGDDDLDDEADDSEKGDDWEHEEIFSDDDENSPEEIEDFATEVPAPPKLKQDDDEDDNSEEEGGLSKSGKELKKLLGRLDESDTEDDNDNGSEDMDNDIDDSPLKPVASGSAQTIPSTTKGKRKSNDYDAKAPTSTPSKKVKTENDQKPSVKVEHASAGPVTEEEIKAVLMQQSPIPMRDLISNFSGRLGLPEEKAAFTAILRRMRSQETIYKTPKDDGSLVILRKKVN